MLALTSCGPGRTARWWNWQVQGLPRAPRHTYPRTHTFRMSGIRCAGHMPPTWICTRHAAAAHLHPSKRMCRQQSQVRTSAARVPRWALPPHTRTRLVEVAVGVEVARNEDVLLLKGQGRRDIGPPARSTGRPSSTVLGACACAHNTHARTRIHVCTSASGRARVPLPHVDGRECPCPHVCAKARRPPLTLGSPAAAAARCARTAPRTRA